MAINIETMHMHSSSQITCFLLNDLQGFKRWMKLRVGKDVGKEEISHKFDESVYCYNYIVYCYNYI